jgi:hypothetical protein
MSLLAVKKKLLMGGGVKPIEFRASSSASSSASSITVDKPTGTIAADMLVAIVAGQGTQAPTPSGWTLQFSNGNADSNQAINVFTKLAGSSEPSTYSFALETSGACFAIVAAYSGNVTSFEAGNVNPQSTSNPVVAPGYTSTGVGTLMMAARVNFANPSQPTAPMGMTVRGLAASPYNLSGVLIDQASHPAGATGNKSINFGDGFFGKAVLIKLK